MPNFSNQQQPPDRTPTHGVQENVVVDLNPNRHADPQPLTDLARTLETVDRMIRLQNRFDHLAPREDGAYKLDHARRLLANPVPHNLRIISPDADDLLAHKRLGVPRAKVSQPDSEKVYDGKWYFQGSDGTCVVWSIANSLKIQGKEIEPKALLGLLNAAIHHGKDKKHGLGYSFASSILQLDTDFSLGLSISTNRLTCTKYLISTTEDFDRYSRQVANIYKQFEFGDAVNNALAGYFEERSKSRPLGTANEQNARVIKEALDAGRPLIVTLIPEFFHSDEPERLADTCLHAVVIAGYYVHKGVMDLQIVDSSNGIYWTSLEHLTNSLLFFPETVEVSATGVDLFAQDLLKNQNFPRRDLLDLMQSMIVKKSEHH